MESNNLIGREYEKGLLNNYYNSPKPELVAIYGRRRVGKTFLVKKTFGQQFAFSFTGMYNTSRAIQLKEFKRSLEKYSGESCLTPKNWFEAFNMLSEYLDTLKQERIVVFLDELPWMDTPKGNFLGAFGRFWNDWASTKDNFKLIVCGSATTWMVSKFIGNKGGLYGRVCRPIHLAPFTLLETEKFLHDVKGIEYNRKQITDVYMILGGIPFYLDMLVVGQPLSKCIDDLFFRDGAPLRNEYDFLFRSLFNDSKVYRRVIEYLSDNVSGKSRQDIMNDIKLQEGGNLTEILDNLVKCDFIRKFTVIGKNSRDAQYQLTDNFTLFYNRFVSNNSGQDEHFWTNIDGKPLKSSWSGSAFEQICLLHIRQIKEALGISGILSNVHSWSCKPFVDADGTQWKGGQIDLIIDRSDNVINICEMKYASDTYTITSDYEQSIRHRASLFQKMTKTRKALQHVFVTTYGISANNYSHLVQNSVILDDLFK